MMTKPIRSKLTALALVGLLGACGSDGGGDGVASVGGSGSGDSASSDNATAAEEKLLDWVECMRDEGIDIPDPTRDEDGNLVIDGPGIQIGGGDGGVDEGGGDGEDEGDPIDPEAMHAAMEACGDPPLVGGEFSEEDRQAMQDAALEFAQCMRDEGIEDLPDPDFSDVGPGGRPQTDEDDASGDGGSGPRIVLGPFGEIDMDDPEVAAAFEACQDIIGPPPGGGDVETPSDEDSEE